MHPGHVVHAHHLVSHEQTLVSSSSKPNQDVRPPPPRMGNCVCQASRHGGVPAGTTGDDGGEPVWAERGETCEERKKTVKVTVRISKSRLQKLMASGAAGGGEGMTLGKVLAEIVSAGEVQVVDGRHRRRWEPALESIPEAMES